MVDYPNSSKAKVSESSLLCCLTYVMSCIRPSTRLEILPVSVLREVVQSASADRWGGRTPHGRRCPSSRQRKSVMSICSIIRLSQSNQQYAQLLITILISSSHDRRSRAVKAARPAVKSVQWVLAKKERRRQQDKPVKSDSKFSGRKRSTPF